MAKSGFSHTAARAAQNAPWVQTWTPGPALANLFNLYPSRGNVTIATATNLPAMVDGPIQVDRFGALTVNALLSGVVRNRGRVILADSLTMGAAGSISMTARGAAGSPKWANQDILIPTSITLSGQNTSYRAFIQWLAANGYAIFDPSLFACPPPGMGDVVADYASWPGRGGAIISAAGCGVGGNCVPAQGGAANGANGLAGTHAPGGGASGAPYAGSTSTAVVMRGGDAKVWSGGARGLGLVANSGVWQFGSETPQYGGPNAGDGPGGVLMVIVRYNLIVTAGHVFTAAALTDNTAYAGGFGGGRVFVAYGGTLTGTLNMIASGGAAYAGTPKGGDGAVGGTDAKTFAQMGWT